MFLPEYGSREGKKWKALRMFFPFEVGWSGWSQAGGFDIWRPQNFGYFSPPPPSLSTKSILWFVPKNETYGIYVLRRSVRLHDFSRSYFPPKRTNLQKRTYVSKRTFFCNRPLFVRKFGVFLDPLPFCSESDAMHGSPLSPSLASCIFRPLTPASDYWPRFPQRRGKINSASEQASVPQNGEIRAWSSDFIK